MECIAWWWLHEKPKHVAKLYFNPNKRTVYTIKVWMSYFVTCFVDRKTTVYCHVWGAAWRIIVGYRFDNWIYRTSVLQLHLIATVHPLNSFLITKLSLHVFLLLLGLVSNLTLGISFLVKLKSKSHWDWRPVSMSWCRAPSGAHYHIFITVWQLRSCFVGLPLWREDGSVFCICCWSSPAQPFSGQSPLGLATIFYCLRFETSVFVASYDSQGYGGGIRPRLHTGILNN
jgi:hypothetical protein